MSDVAAAILQSGNVPAQVQQAQANVQQVQAQQVQQVQQEVISPLVPNAVAPTPTVQTDQVIPQVAPQVAPQVQPEPTYVNPYAQPTPEVTATTNYIDSSIAHLTNELGVSADAFDAVIDGAIEHNDLKLINIHALGQLTPQQAQRVQQLATAAVQHAQQEIQAGVQAAKATVHAAAGGEAAWQTAVQAFNANADKHAQGYAAYLAETDVKAAADYVLNFNKQNGFTNQVYQAPIQGGNGGTATGLSAMQYKAELATLELEAGNRSLGSGVYGQRMADLDARRRLGRQQGL